MSSPTSDPAFNAAKEVDRTEAAASGHFERSVSRSLFDSDCKLLRESAPNVARLELARCALGPKPGVARDTRASRTKALIRIMLFFVAALGGLVMAERKIPGFPLWTPIVKGSLKRSCRRVVSLRYQPSHKLLPCTLCTGLCSLLVVDTSMVCLVSLE